VITSFYYSVTACATGGLQAPSDTPVGMVFTGVLCMIGIPLYALALTDIATFIVDRILRSHAKEAVSYEDCLSSMKSGNEPVDLDWVFFLEKELEREDKALLLGIRNKYRCRTNIVYRCDESKHTENSRT